MTADAQRTCDACGQPIPRTAKFASSSVSAEQLEKLKRAGRLQAQPDQAGDGRYALTLCLNCRIELASASSSRAI